MPITLVKGALVLAGIACGIAGICLAYYYEKKQHKTYSKVVYFILLTAAFIIGATRL